MGLGSNPATTQQGMLISLCPSLLFYKMKTVLVYRRSWEAYKEQPSVNCYLMPGTALSA